MPEKDMLVIQTGDPIKGTKDQRRCKKCHAARERLNELCTQEGITRDHLKELSPQDRAEFMANAQDLCGKDLAKALTETVVYSRLRRESNSLHTKGQFKPLDEAEADYRHKPEAWENLKKNAPRLRHQYTLEELIWCPHYDMSNLLEDISSESRQRQVESETKVKRARIAKVEKPAVASTDEPNRAKIAPIPEGQLKRLVASFTKMQQLQLSMSALLVEAEQDAVKENIPPKTLTEAKNALEMLDNLVEKADGMQKEKMAAQGQMKSLFENIKQVYATSEKYENKMRGLVEDALPESEKVDTK